MTTQSTSTQIAFWKPVPQKGCVYPIREEPLRVTFKQRKDIKPPYPLLPKFQATLCRMKAMCKVGAFWEEQSEDVCESDFGRSNGVDLNCDCKLCVS